MREIIHISTGQCGNQIGSAFWETINAEHGIDGSGKRHVPPEGINPNERLDVYYAESNKRYVPRSVMIDLEPATLDNVKAGPMGELFRPDNYVNAVSSAGNNWAKGFYTEGAEILDQCLDVIRREVEGTENLQGFQLTHSLGGGTGSGLGTLLLNSLHDEYNDRMIASYSVFPSNDSDTVVEPYNSVLALSQLVENANETFCLDNHALYDIFQKILKVQQPEHTDINNLVAQVMSGVTTSLRYPGQLNSDLRKLATNLVPFNRLHFFSVAYAPLLTQTTRKFSNVSVQEISKQILDGRCLMAGIDPRQGKYLTCAAIWRGANVSIKETEDEMMKFRLRNEDLFVNFIPDNAQTSLCTTPPKNSDIAATFVANSTSIGQLFQRVHTQFSKMFQRKAFLHWYTNEGMDTSEFTEAEANIADLMSDYEQHVNSGLGFDEEDIIIDDGAYVEGEEMYEEEEQPIDA